MSLDTHLYLFMFYCNKIEIRLFKSMEIKRKTELIQCVKHSFTTKTYVVMATLPLWLRDPTLTSHIWHRCRLPYCCRAHSHRRNTHSMHCRCSTHRTRTTTTQPYHQKHYIYHYCQKYIHCNQIHPNSQDLLLYTRDPVLPALGILFLDIPLSTF